MITPLVERLRSRSLIEAGNGIPELCEEAARHIEHLTEKVTLLTQQVEYLGAGASTRSATWQNDT